MAPNQNSSRLSLLCILILFYFSKTDTFYLFPRKPPGLVHEKKLDSKVALKVKKPRKQIMVSSIFPNNEHWV